LNPKLIAYIFGPTIFDSEGGSLDGFSPIVDTNIIEKIKSGESRGLSPEVKIKWFQCGICKNNYEEDCDHIEGKFYDNKKCILYPRDIKFLALSIVNVPEDPKARITDMLIVDNTNKKIHYSWYGFDTDKYNRRFKHIQKASDLKLISEKIALKFSTYFISNPLGTLSL